MSLKAPAGFTLVELMVALVLGGVTAMLAFALLGAVGAGGRARAERGGLQANLRGGAALVAAELRQAGADSISGSDLVTIGPLWAVFRALGAFGVTCRVAVDTLDVRADSATYAALRAPVPGRDSLLLYAAGDSLLPVDAWQPLPLLAPAGSTTCPDGTPAYRWLTRLDSLTLAVRRFTQSAPVRTFEIQEIRLYQSGGVWALGVREVSGGGTIQPMAGPFAPGGMTLTFLTRVGLPAGLPGVAATVALDLSGLTHRELAVGPFGTPAARSDSLSLRQVLRNVP